MGKTLHIINTIIILCLLIFSAALLIIKYPSSLDIALTAAANIYLIILFCLLLAWSIFLFLSYFRTNINNSSYSVSAIINITSTIIGILISIMILAIIKLSQLGKITMNESGDSLSWILAFISEGSLLLFLILLPIALLTSLIIFLAGYYKNKKKDKNTEVQQ